MRVERKVVKPVFEPVVITIETHEELAAIYNGLIHEARVTGRTCDTFTYQYSLASKLQELL